MAKILKSLRSLCRALFKTAPLARCHCKLLYKLPEGPIGRIDLGAALCADAETLEAIEILGLVETGRCDKQGECPWLQAAREGGIAALRKKLFIHAAASLYAPDRADGDGEVGLVEHPDSEPVAINAVAGKPVTRDETPPNPSAQPDPFAAPVKVKGGTGNAGRSDAKPQAQAVHSPTPVEKNKW